MDNIYTVIRIDEPDFGCEGLPDGAVYKDIVRIKDMKSSLKSQMRIYMKMILTRGTAWLYRMEVL